MAYAQARYTSAPLPDGGSPLLLTVTLGKEGPRHVLTVRGVSGPSFALTKTWQWAEGDLSAPLLNEIGAVVEDMTQHALLGVLGVQGSLAFELLQAIEAI